MNTAKLEYDLAYARQQITSLTAELAAAQAELKKARADISERERERNKIMWEYTAMKGALSRIEARALSIMQGVDCAVHASYILADAQRGLGGDNA